MVRYTLPNSHLNKIFYYLMQFRKRIGNPHKVRIANFHKATQLPSPRYSNNGVFVVNKTQLTLHIYNNSPPFFLLQTTLMCCGIWMSIHFLYFFLHTM